MRRVRGEEVVQWKRLYEEKKLSIPAIARKAGRNHHVVYYHLLRCGTQIRSGQVGAEVTPDEVSEWVSMFLAGENPEDFRNCERTLQTIYKHLARGLKRHYEKLIGKEVTSNAGRTRT